MKKGLIVLAAAATLGMAVPASAQVYLGAGPGGVEVDVGGYRHDGWRHRHHGYRGYAYRDCREVRTRIVTRHGRVVFRTRTVCD